MRRMVLIADLFGLVLISVVVLLWAVGYIP